MKKVRILLTLLFFVFGIVLIPKVTKLYSDYEKIIIIIWFISEIVLILYRLKFYLNHKIEIKKFIFIELFGVMVLFILSILKLFGLLRYIEYHYVIGGAIWLRGFTELMRGHMFLNRRVLSKYFNIFLLSIGIFIVTLNNNNLFLLNYLISSFFIINGLFLIY